MYLTFRTLHILSAALWIGMTFTSSMFLIPAAASLGKDADKLGAALQRLGFVIAMPVIATLTVLTGAWLYWRFTGGFSAEASHTHSAMSLGAGAAFAITAYLIGALVVGRSMTRANDLAAQAAKATGESDRARLLSTAQALRRRAAVSAKIVFGLQLITLVLMSIANYI